MIDGPDHFQERKEPSPEKELTPSQQSMASTLIFGQPSVENNAAGDQPAGKRPEQERPRGRPKKESVMKKPASKIVQRPAAARHSKLVKRPAAASQKESEQAWEKQYKEQALEKQAQEKPNIEEQGIGEQWGPARGAYSERCW